VDVFIVTQCTYVYVRKMPHQRPVYWLEKSLAANCPWYSALLYLSGSDASSAIFRLCLWFMFELIYVIASVMFAVLSCHNMREIVLISRANGCCLWLFRGMLNLSSHKVWPAQYIHCWRRFVFLHCEITFLSDWHDVEWSSFTNVVGRVIRYVL